VVLDYVTQRPDWVVEAAPVFHPEVLGHWKVLDERQILRLDHFLGKEPAVDILFLRFANSILEPLWNRDRIHSVQITGSSTFKARAEARSWPKGFSTTTRARLVRSAAARPSTTQPNSEGGISR
jgi:hypothetical protein